MAKNFDAWWNEHYFYEKNGPLYRAFEKFDQLEGDLDYIDFLRKVLRWGDANLAKSPPDRARRRLESFVRSYDKELAENFQYIGLLAIEFTKRKMAERYLLDRDHLGLLSSRDIGEILIAVGKALSDIKNERFMVYNQSVVSTFAREADKNPLLYLLSDNGRVKRARGNQKGPPGAHFFY